MSATPRLATTTAALLHWLGEPSKENWTLFYPRGVCNERGRIGRRWRQTWKKALELSPYGFPVLNYLGYTWIDQSQNLKTAMDYIPQGNEDEPRRTAATSRAWAGPIPASAGSSPRGSILSAPLS